MARYICRTCGAEYGDEMTPPTSCLICEDERQYVGWNGQEWTTRDRLLREGHRNDMRELEAGLAGISVTPAFAIGQRAILVQTSSGNVLYDCVSLLDDATRAAVEEKGGIDAITLSHPHFYAAMVSWSHAFGGCPVYVPDADRAFVPRPDDVIQYWNGDSLEILSGITLVRVGGHFPGSSVLHWADGAEGRGALLVGDSMAVVPDRRYVSFMFSYPNLIPASANAVSTILDSLEPFAFERIYGGWWERDVLHDAKQAVRSSAQRYISHLEGRRG